MNQNNDDDDDIAPDSKKKAVWMNIVQNELEFGDKSSTVIYWAEMLHHHRDFQRLAEGATKQELFSLLQKLGIGEDSIVFKQTTRAIDWQNFCSTDFIVKEFAEVLASDKKISKKELEDIYYLQMFHSVLCAK